MSSLIGKCTLFLAAGTIEKPRVGHIMLSPGVDPTSPGCMTPEQGYPHVRYTALLLPKGWLSWCMPEACRSCHNT
jgi:hypothetical protein